MRPGRNAAPAWLQRWRREAIARGPLGFGAAGMLSASAMRILFITSTRLGDAVLSTGLVEHLRQRDPDARFTIACGPVAEGVFARLPGREATVVVEKRRFDLHWAGLWASCLRPWDLAVDLRGSAVTLMLPARRRRIMRGGRRPGHRLTHLAGVLGLAEPPAPVIWTDDSDRQRARALLPCGPLYVGLGPTANWSGKIWPAERFAALFEAIASVHPQAVPVIFAGPGEAEARLAAPVVAALDAHAPVVLAGLEIAQVAAALQRCALFVGNDSGLMHVAGAAGTPTVGLFGPSRVSEYGPTSARSLACVAPGPDGRAPIDQLSVGTVLDAALSLLEPGRVQAAA